MAVFKFLLRFGICLLCYAAHASTFDQDWKVLPYDESPCGGRYEPLKNLQTKKSKAHLSADHIQYSAHAMSVLTGNVLFYDNHTELHSDTIYVWNDTKKHEPYKITLKNNVSLLQPEFRVQASKAEYDLHLQEFTGEKVNYRIYNRHARGSALAINAHQQEYQLTDATFTTCAPNHDDWYIKSHKFTVNVDKNYIEGYKSFLYVKNVPVLYLPYIYMSLDHKRQSGFLFPEYYYSNDDGMVLGLPYYFNLASNYDATFTPKWFQKRGLQLTGEYRYLTQHSEGQVNLQLLPHDRAFRTFRNNTLANPPAGLAPSDIRIVDLKDASTNRFAFHVNDLTNISDYFDVMLNYNYVSDSEYLRDFKEQFFTIGNTNQLLQMAKLNFHNNNIQANLLLKNYQILHPVSGPITTEPYKIIPQFNFKAFYPQESHNLNLGVIAQVSNFQSPSNPNLEQNEHGYRKTLVLQAGYPIVTPSLYLNPAIQFKHVDYDLYFKDLSERDSPINHPHFNFPIATLDAKLNFTSNFSFNKKNYTQLLSPHLFYLYVPLRNQNGMPLYDTNYASINYEQLFRTNQFVGFDRQSNANQLTYAVNSSWLDMYGKQLASFDLAQSYYFTKPAVTLCDRNRDPNCMDDPHFVPQGSTSPLIARFTINPDANFLFSLEEQVTTNPRWDNYKTTLFFTWQRFMYNKQRLIDVEYSFIEQGDPNSNDFSHQHNDLQQIKFTLQWPLNINFNVVGFSLFDIENRYPIDILGALEYESCCFAVRGGYRRYLLERDHLNPERKYNYAIFLEFSLKGLAGFSNGETIGNFLLNNNVIKYQDNFAKSF